MSEKDLFALFYTIIVYRLPFVEWLASFVKKQNKNKT